jgi:hypothetical protein
LTEKQQDDISQTHVDLMLSVADQYGLKRVEEFHLMGPQDVWQRFWLIEFPTMEGAEQWIQADEEAATRLCSTGVRQGVEKH